MWLMWLIKQVVMKQVFFMVAFLAMGVVSNAQTWQWGRRGGGSAGSNNKAEKIVDMLTDAKGNVYMLTQLDGGGDATMTTNTIDSFIPNQWGNKDVALISYDCGGKLRWSKVFGSVNYDEDAVGMSMDSLGHINIAMSTKLDFNLDNDSTVANTKFKSIGIAQYDTAGHYKWFKQPNTDSASSSKNISHYGVFNIATTPSGDTYLYCYLGTGLISGSTNLVVTTAGWYMLKYNIAGVPKELIKLDMNIPLAANGSLLGDYFAYSNFSVTKSRKFIFTGIRVARNSSYPITVGGQALKHPLNLFCFNPTGSVLWRVENSDTSSGGISNRPYIDETKGLIYIAGGGIWGTQRVDTIGGVPIINLGTKGFLPFWACLDTLGNFTQVKWGSCNLNGSNSLRDLTFRSDGRLYAYGDGGGVIWGSFYYNGSNGVGGNQTFIPSFDATTGTIMSMDSLKGSSVTLAGVIAADNNNNIYVGGQLSSDIKIGSQTLQSAGGLSDFFVAKYGYNNCTIVPVKMVNYQLLMVNEKQVINSWRTATEINTRHFNIQRSTNGKDFVTVGLVMAKGAGSYLFTDKLPTNYSPFTTYYYRLEIIDYDGAKQYSEIKQIRVNQLTNQPINIYPNPANDFVNISCIGMKEIKIINQLGKIIQQINNPTEHQTINTKQLLRGVYFVQVITKGNEIKNGKLIVE